MTLPRGCGEKCWPASMALLTIPVFSFRGSPLSDQVPLVFRWGQSHPLAREAGVCPRMDAETSPRDFCSNYEERGIRFLWKLPCLELLVAILFSA